MPYIGMNVSTNICIGFAKNIEGLRTRISYIETIPGHEYEETVEITIINRRKEDVRIKIIEHLSRSADFEIVSADDEYTRNGGNTIVFFPSIKGGKKNTLRYTVKYRW